MLAQPKSSQLQIRVSAAEKRSIQRAAREAGLDMSAYVLARLLPAQARRFTELVGACRDPAGARYALAELNTWLESLAAGELRSALAAPPSGLTSYFANYVAAMIEVACSRRGVHPPDWIGTIAPLAEPVFGSELLSLRLYLLTHSPAPFRRRNIFIDATVGDRV